MTRESEAPLTQSEFIGTTPLDDWKQARGGSFFIPREREPVRVFLNDGTVHVYHQYLHEIGSRKTDGGHGYAVSSAGALHVVEFASTAHRGDEGVPTKIVTDIQVAVTYSPAAWHHVTGPTEKAPKKAVRETKRVGEDRA